MDPQNLALLYARHKDELVGLAFTILQNHAAAEDAVHQAFANLCRGKRHVDDQRAYLFRSVRNAALDQASQIARQVSDIAMTDPVSHPVDPRPELRSAFETLSSEKQQVVMLKVKAGMTFAEIGAVLDRSENTIASTYRRSLLELRSILGEENLDD